MEGPSILLAAENLRPFVGKKVLEVRGNTKIGKERLLGKKVTDIFSWGKVLLFQFDTFALKIHFLLFGNYEATVNGKSVTGDYKRFRSERLYMRFKNGEIKIFTSSVKFLETSHARDEYDFSVDVLSDKWDEKAALKKVLSSPKEEIADVLLDQTIFSGVGNIIKNEILFLSRVHPETKIKDLPKKKVKELISLTRSFSRQFYEWKKIFELKKHLLIYRKTICPACGGKVFRKFTGRRHRWSFICPVDQPFTILDKPKQ